MEKRRQRERKGLAVKPQKGPNTGRSNNRRDYSLRYKYGITEEQYNQLLKKQKHKCAVCGKHEDEEKRKLAVDHNHRTGEIRGLLCTYCNHRVVGRWTDGNLLRKVADYVDQGTGWFVPKKKKRKKRHNSNKGQ
jgi:DNA-directed RNA polymerase subunit RPC12/RpoP